MALVSAASNRSIDEVTAAIKALSVADRVRVKRAAQYFCRHWTMSPDDLLQEAILRALEGGRKCPRNIEIVVFLIGIIRSLSSTEARAMKRKPVLHVVPMIGEGDESFDPPDGRPDPEAQLAEVEAAAATKKRILDVFSDDLIAQTVAEGIMDNMEGKELLDLCGLNEKGLATKRRLVKRRLEKEFPDGWKP
jgi:RNA polymerase sigma-70 factor (ECF subfamily)